MFVLVKGYLYTFMMSELRGGTSTSEKKILTFSQEKFGENLERSSIFF